MKYNGMLLAILCILPIGFAASGIHDILSLRSLQSVNTQWPSLVRRSDDFDIVLERRGKKKSKERASLGQGGPATRQGAANNPTGRGSVSSQQVSSSQSAGSSRQAGGARGSPGSQEATSSQAAQSSRSEAGPSNAEGSQHSPHRQGAQASQGAKKPEPASSTALVKYVTPEERAKLLAPKPQSPPRPRKPNTRTSPPRNRQTVEALQSSKQLSGIIDRYARDKNRYSYSPAKEATDVRLKTAARSKMAASKAARHEANDARREHGPSDPRTFEAMDRFEHKSVQAESALVDRYKEAERLEGHGLPTPAGYAARMRIAQRFDTRKAHRGAMFDQWMTDVSEEKTKKAEERVHYGNAALAAKFENPRTPIWPYNAVRNLDDMDNRDKRRQQLDSLRKNSEASIDRMRDSQRQMKMALDLFPGDSSSDESEKSVKVTRKQSQ